VLVSNYVFGTVTAVIVGSPAAVAVAALWFVVPLRHRPDRAEALTRRSRATI
jgi:hypothetical protein